MESLNEIQSQPVRHFIHLALVTWDKGEESSAHSLDSSDVNQQLARCHELASTYNDKYKPKLKRSEIECAAVHPDHHTHLARTWSLLENSGCFRFWSLPMFNIRKAGIP